jgi:DNA-binding SARP family transcriptional activator
MLSVSLLGTPTLTLDGRPLPLTRRKSRAILYYIAAHDKSLTREHLLNFFWPDLDRPAAQQTLRTTLHGLRKALGPSLIVEEDTIALAPDTQIDVRDFETAIRPASRDHPATRPPDYPTTRLQDSLALYRGDFLEGFSLPGTPTFDDWAAVERERYRRLAVRGLAALGQLHESNGDFTAALEALDRALAFDSLQEDLQRAAMRLHYLAGDRAAAIRRYDSLRKLLDDEMGVPPMTETRAVYDSIINDTLATPNLKPQTPKSQPPSLKSLITNLQLPFTGRTAELQTLRALSASHRLALVEGEPGIGKTRLAEEYINASNAIALSGAAHELEHALPYQPIIEALRGLLARTDWPALQAALHSSVSPVWLAEVARLLPELGSALASQQVQTPADESRLWEGLHQFLLVIAEQHPVILFIDDIQWADASTLALLGYLTRRGQPAAPITYLAAARPVNPRSPLASLLQTLTRENRLSRLPLRRLTRDDITAIARSISPTYAVPLAEARAVAESSGRQRLLDEIARVEKLTEH